MALECRDIRMSFGLLFYSPSRTDYPYKMPTEIA